MEARAVDWVAVLLCCIASVVRGRGQLGGVWPMAAIRRDVAMCERATNYSADMTVWQYAQLTVTVERRPPQGDTWTALWHGPGLNDSEDYSQSGQTVLELLNQFGADGWELAGIQNHNDGEAGSSRGGAHRLITV